MILFVFFTTLIAVAISEEISQKGLELFQQNEFLPLDKICEYEKFMPQKNIFAGIVFLRIAIPIDVISYAIGLFTNISFVPYFFATLLGFLPSAFFLAYIGTLPAHMQIIGFAVFLLVVIVGFLSVKYKHVKMI